MKNVTHETVGATGALAVCTIASADILTTAGCVLVSVLGSRLPDVCQLGSKIHRKTSWERRNPLVALAGFVLRLPMKLFAVLAQHRGSTHWLSTGAVLTAACAVAASAVDFRLLLPVAAGLGAGYTLHLLADACTPHGVPLLGPFTKKKVHLLSKQHRIPTGSGREMIVCIGALFLAGLLVMLGAGA